MISSIPAQSSLNDLNQGLSTLAVSSAASSPASLPAEPELASAPSAPASLPLPRARTRPSRAAVELVSPPRRPAPPPPRSSVRDTPAVAVGGQTTQPPSAPGKALTPEDIKALCKVHAVANEQSDPDVRSIIPFLYGISSAWEREGDTPSAQLGVAERMKSLIEEIARTPKFEIPAIPALWEAARTLDPEVGRLLRLPEVTRQIPVGAQLAVEAFLRSWDRMGLAEPCPVKTSTLSKCVPVASDLTIAPAFMLDVLLTPVHPRPGTPVASSPQRDLAKEFSWSPHLAPPWFTITSVQGGLQLATAPVPVEDRQSLHDAQVALSAMQARLFEAAARGQGLSDALARFNQTVPKAWQLTLQPGISQTQSAQLLCRHSGLQGSAHKVWFKYECLGQPDGLEDLLDDPRSRQRLKRAHEFAALATVRQLHAWRKRHPETVRSIRSELLKGCATQHCMEIARGPQSAGTDLQFKVSVQDVRQVMTSAEKSVLDAILTEVESQLKESGYKIYSVKPRAPRHLSVVSLDKGDPMGCVLLQTMPERTHAQGPSDPMARSAGPGTAPGSAGAVPPLASGLRFDQLKLTVSQPHWLNSMSKDYGVEEPELLLSEPINTEFTQDYDAAMNKLLEDIRTPGLWSRFDAELGPRLLAHCPGWPKGRALFIHNVVDGGLLSAAGPKGSAMEPIRVARSMDDRHYLPLADGRMLDVPYDGDCLYTAVLAAMQPQERLALLKACGCPEADGQTLGRATLALRRHFADHLSRHREVYQKQIIEWHAVLD